MDIVVRKPFGHCNGRPLKSKALTCTTERVATTDQQSSIGLLSVERAAFSVKANTVMSFEYAINSIMSARTHARFAPQASGAGDNTVRFWDINTETPRHECRAHRQYVLALAWAPDGRRLASGDKVRALARAW